MSTESSWLQVFWVVLCCASTIPTLLVAVVRIPKHKFSSGIEIEVYGEPDPSPPLPQFKKRHRLFYIVGLLWIILILWTLAQSRCIAHGAPCWIDSVLHIVATPARVSTDVTSMLLALCVLLTHLATRWYTSSFVSVFSRKVKWELLDLVLAYPYFLLVGLSIAAEAPRRIYSNYSCLDTANFQWRHLVGIILYLWASYHHSKSHQILASLRKNEKGQVITQEYKLPTGGWFDEVTCPHYFAEIIIHIAIGCILGLRHATWWTFTIYVFLNHVCLAHSTRQAYMTLFNDFPRDKKMLIPYLL